MSRLDIHHGAFERRGCLCRFHFRCGDGQGYWPRAIGEEAEMPLPRPQAGLPGEKRLQRPNPGSST